MSETEMTITEKIAEPVDAAAEKRAAAYDLLREVSAIERHLAGLRSGPRGISGMTASETKNASRPTGRTAQPTRSRRIRSHDWFMDARWRRRSDLASDFPWA